MPDPQPTSANSATMSDTLNTVSGVTVGDYLIKRLMDYGVRDLFAAGGEIVTAGDGGFVVKGEGGLVPRISGVVRSRKLAPDDLGHGFGFRLVGSP